MRDFESYYAAGTAWNRGADPYGLSIWQSERVLPGVAALRNEVLPFVGPPATLPIWSILARMPFSAANDLWRSILILFIAASIVTALRLSGIALKAVSFFAATAFAVGFGPLTSCLALGQIALPAFACAALAVKWPPAGILAWVQPNVALSLLSQVRRRKGAAAFAAGAAVFVLACIAVAGVGGVTRYAGVLRAHEDAERFSAIQLTPAAIAYGFGATERTATLIGFIAALVCAIVWLLLMRAGDDSAVRFCGTCTLLPIAMPFFHEHDLVVVFVPAVYFSLRCRARAWPAVAAGGLLCATDWLGLAQRPDGAVQTVLLISGAALALFALRRDLRPASLLVPVSVLVAIGIAALYAQSHPAPVWPDAMSAVSLAPATNIADAWRAEQLATGLLQPQPFWALLRSLSLLGCAVLCCAAFARSPLDYARGRSIPHDDTMVHAAL